MWPKIKMSVQYHVIREIRIVSYSEEKVYCRVSVAVGSQALTNASLRCDVNTAHYNQQQQ